MKYKIDEILKRGQPLLLRKGIRSAEVKPLRQETTAGTLASGRV
ncbi:hypothetical protein [Erwinia sp. S43]|nr:hypothetical protein [Erwinia sp. S43]